jgi:prepilin-type N-terminal cleavage/methylation domain-containing protein
MEKFLNNPKGFTLAEVLITLLIIGVVSSLVIPAIINDTQEAEFKVAWKKAFGSASQAYKMAIIDNGGIGFGDYGATPSNGITKFNILKNYFNVSKSCIGNTYGNCWASSGVGPDSLNTAYCLELSYQNANRAFVTTDGVSYMLCDNAYAIVAVDVNGPKSPNEWGKDVFQFYIRNVTIFPTSEELTYHSKRYLYQ